MMSRSAALLEWWHDPEKAALEVQDYRQAVSWVNLGTRRARAKEQGLRTKGPRYSTVTLLARFLGWSTSQPRRIAMWYAMSCSGTTKRIGASSA